VGRRKRAGTGSTASGLHFDVLGPRPADLAAVSFVVERVDVFDGSGAPTVLAAMAPQATATVVARLRNTGRLTWLRTGPAPARLATATPPDHPGVLATPTWRSPTRPASPREASIATGQRATFVFEVRAPSTPGPFEERFDVVVEGRARPEDCVLVVAGRVAG
jgi:hypothetical protein